jgi:hypothetical protein
VRPTLNPILHELVSRGTYVIRMRDRLRCPRCKAVGTWKPHGSRMDRKQGDRRAVRRWLCKWCGLYFGPEGWVDAVVDFKKHEWALPTWLDFESMTPQEAVNQSPIAGAFPWRG